jgi:hypothetical protein
MAQPPKSKLPLVLTILAGIVVLGGGSCVACLVWIASQPEGGVRVANQVQPYAFEYMRQHNILAEGERLIAYYDASMSMDGSESAILTDQRVIYDVAGRTTSLDLADVDDIEARDEGLVGDVIEVTDTSGGRLRIEIAPLNDGKAFVRYLREAVAVAQKGAAETN